MKQRAVPPCGQPAAAVLRDMLLWSALLLAALVVLPAASVDAQQSQPAAGAAKAAESSQKKGASPLKPALEPKALAILKAACNRLAAAHSMAFTAVVMYESPSLLGPPLAYMTKSEVTMERPDKLRVITLGDGPPSDFYYNGKTMMAFAPVQNLVAIAPAPPTIDAALKKAYDRAAIYFPFSDLIVSNPYKDLSQGLKVAFYIGRSKVVGGTTTDMVAYANDAVFVQVWIGAKDKLPRMLRAVFSADPSRMRHQLELSDWQIDPSVPPGAFTSAKAKAAKRIVFARPDPRVPPRFTPPPKAKRWQHQ